ncbi:MAG: hypothetical protein ACR2LV_12235, partial [Solirubrobacteraceae bacterium]
MEGGRDSSGADGRRAAPGVRAAPVTLVIVAVVLALVACGGGASGSQTQTVGRFSNWKQVLGQARGQTVRWWLYGGDDKINAFVKNVVTPAARELGVTVMPVRVD